MRGYFGIGIENPKTSENVGTLWRTAYNLGASFIFTIGRRVKKQCSDTVKAWKSIPYYTYGTLHDFLNNRPRDSFLIGLESCCESMSVKNFVHPQSCIYLLGSEDNGLSQDAINACQVIVELPGARCHNVAVAGALIMYDRIMK